MATACADHLFLHHLNIPPRRLLSDADSDADDPYSSDDFRMFEFKVRRCTRPRSHDWTDCPFAHPGEKARRRDPRRHHYSPTLCPDFRRSGSCPLSDDCRFSHGVFEAWLHPSRYRTEACKDGKKCKRKVCFFAHTPRELRLPPPDHLDSEGQIGKFTCCMHCACSPRSTLAVGVSPPLSPADQRITWVDQQRAVAAPTYEHVLSELLRAVNLKESAAGGGGLWVDVVRENTPSLQTPVSSKSYFSGGGGGFSFDGSPMSSGSTNAVGEDDGIEGSDDPDLGWVNDLLT